jgi:mono/diheme cytochrome c family protein
VVVRSHSLPGIALPLAGGAVFTILVATWLTSGFWFISNNGFPSPVSAGEDRSHPGAADVGARGLAVLLLFVGPSLIGADKDTAGSAAQQTAAPSGKAVFASAGCGGCHTLAAAGSSGASGPNLDDAKPSAQRVQQIVTSGEGGMPSFGSRLSSAEIKAVAAFVSGTEAAATATATATATPARGDQPTVAKTIRAGRGPTASPSTTRAPSSGWPTRPPAGWCRSTPTTTPWAGRCPPAVSPTARSSPTTGSSGSSPPATTPCCESRRTAPPSASRWAGRPSPWP